jgi:hypothetical protein
VSASTKSEDCPRRFDHDRLAAFGHDPRDAFGSGTNDGADLIFCVSQGPMRPMHGDPSKPGSSTDICSRPQPIDKPGSRRL